MTYITETAYILNSLLFLLAGVVGMLAVLGFSLVEAGALKEKNAGLVLLKNAVLFAITGLVFFVLGYNVMYDEQSTRLLFWAPDDNDAFKTRDFSAGYTSGSDWFFQAIYASIPVFIVSTALSVRVKIWPFLIFCTVLVGIIYPVAGGWIWGSKWLSQKGLLDFGGATLVHSLGGWCALTGAAMLGLIGKRSRAANVNLHRPNINFTAAGVFLLWLAILGMNSGAQLAFGTAIDAISVSNIMVNTLLAGCAGMVASLVIYAAIFRKINRALILSGMLGGLVSISAEPLLPSPGVAAFIGATGGIIVTVVTLLLNRKKINDLSGVIPAHLVCGIWGTLVVSLTNPNASFLIQLLGVISVAVFALAASALAWLGLKLWIGIEVRKEKDLLVWE